MQELVHDGLGLLLLRPSRFLYRLDNRLRFHCQDKEATTVTTVCVMAERECVRIIAMSVQWRAVKGESHQAFGLCCGPRVQGQGRPLQGLGPPGPRVQGQRLQGLGVQGLGGFRVTEDWDIWFSDWDRRFRVWDLGFRVEDHFRVWDLRFRVRVGPSGSSGSESETSTSGSGTSGSGSGTSGSV